MQNENEVLQAVKSVNGHLVHDVVVGTVSLYAGGDNPHLSMMTVDPAVFTKLRDGDPIVRVRGREQIRYELASSN